MFYNSFETDSPANKRFKTPVTELRRVPGIEMCIYIYTPLKCHLFSSLRCGYIVLTDTYTDRQAHRPPSGSQIWSTNLTRTIHFKVLRLFWCFNSNISCELLIQILVCKLVQILFCKSKISDDLFSESILIL